MKKLTKQQKLRAREILAQADTEDLLWISDAACAEFDKREVEKCTYAKFAVQRTKPKPLK